MRALVWWLLARRVGRVEAERFLEELDELHARKRAADGEEAGDRWLKKELRMALISGMGRRVQPARQRGDGKGDRSVAPGPGSRGHGRASWLAGFLRDLRHGLRTLRRRPLFASLVIGTLGLGIGASTTVFSLVDNILLEDMAYERPGELVTIWAMFPSWREDPVLVEAWDKIGFIWDAYTALRDQAATFSGVAGHRSGDLVLTGVGDPVRLESGEATSSLFPLLGIRPVLGRTFLPGEEGPGAPRLTVLGYDLWRTRFGSDPGVLGRSVTLDGQSFEVIGVMPPGIRIHSTIYNLMNSAIDPGERALWVPANWDRAPNNGSVDLEVMGRIRPGASLEQAKAEVEGILAEIPRYRDGGFRLTSPRDEVVAGHRSPLFLLLGASGLLLLIACANAATLLLGEAIDRRGEMSTRVAMGASRRHIAQKLLIESLILGLAGSMVGMALTPLGVRAFLALGPNLPRLQNVAVNQGVLLAAALTGVACAVLFGFMPAALQHKHSIHALLQREGCGRVGGRGRAQTLLVAGQLALTMVLLITAGVLGRSLMGLTRVDPGFDAEGVATVRAQVSSRLLGEDREARTVAGEAFQREVLDRVAAIPGVLASGAINYLPFPGHISGNGYTITGSGGGEPESILARSHRASPGYFEAMGIPLLAGQLFRDGNAGADSLPPVLINEAMARRFWPAGSPVGDIILRDDSPCRVVGVVGDVRERHLAEAPFPMVYHPLLEDTGSEFSIVAKGRGSPEALVPALRAAVLAANPNVPVAQEATMETLVAQSAEAERFRAFLVSGFGVLATILALVGVFGVTVRSVAHRAREMGIRMALGAEVGGLVQMVAMGTLWAGLLGIGLGLCGALASTRLLSAFAFGTMAWDGWSYGGAVILLGTLSIGSATLAALRVTRVEPIRVLREE